MLIGIDHGNKQMKCIHRIFISGLVQSNTRPPFGDDILRYKDRFYTLSEQRIPYMRDKSIDNRFFVLTLFAIAYEIQAAGNYPEDDIIDVQLAVGLPPAHYGAQYEVFEKYLLNGNNIIDFEYQDKPYSIYISDVMCFPCKYR